MIKTKESEEILTQLYTVPDLIEEAIETTEEKSKEIARINKDVDLFYCMGSGLNFGLAYKLIQSVYKLYLLNKLANFSSVLF